MSRADDEARYGASLDDLYEEELKREMRAEGRTTPKPKPTGNVCSSCVPWPYKGHTPSGRVREFWYHQTDCAEHPGERVRIGAGVRAGPLVAAVEMEARLNTSEKVNELAASLFAMQREWKMPTTDREADAGSFQYPYLSLPKLVEFIGKRGDAASLSFTQDVQTVDGGVGSRPASFTRRASGSSSGRYSFR